MSNNAAIINMLRGNGTRRNTVACTTATFDEVKWPTVSLQPLFFGEEREAFDSHRAIYNEDMDRVITVATSSYALIDHKQFVEQAAFELEKIGYKDLQCKVSLINNGDKMVAEFKDVDHPLRVNDEEIYPTFVLKNSYDLGWAASVVGGIFRQVCSNGAYVGHANGYQRRHIGGTIETNMANIISSVSTEMKFVEQKFNDMIKTSLKKGEKIRVSSLKLTEAEKNALASMKELSSGAQLTVTLEDDTEVWTVADGGHNMLDVYNLVTEFVTHKVPNPVRRDTLAIATNRLFYNTIH